MNDKIVTVTVDRPLGTYHPRHPDIYYSVNYGYVKGTIAPDGEDQDAYVLGVSKAVSTFTGKVIAIINRENDVENKWVVAPVGVIYTEEEIRNMTFFQEKYFKSTITLLV